MSIQTLKKVMRETTGTSPGGAVIRFEMDDGFIDTIWRSCELEYSTIHRAITEVRINEMRRQAVISQAIVLSTTPLFNLDKFFGELRIGKGWIQYTDLPYSVEQIKKRDVKTDYNVVVCMPPRYIPILKLLRPRERTILKNAVLNLFRTNTDEKDLHPYHWNDLTAMVLYSSENGSGLGNACQYDPKMKQKMELHVKKHNTLQRN